MTDIDLTKPADEATYASFESLDEAAAAEIGEKDVPDVFGGQTVRIRTLTAAQAAQVNQSSIRFGGGRKGQNTEMSFAVREIKTLQYGLVKPSVNMDQARSLHAKAGPSVQKLLSEIRELSGMDDASKEQDEEAFPGSGSE